MSASRCAYIAWRSGPLVEDLSEHATLDRETIRTAPVYDPAAIVERDYELALYRPYGRHFEA